jgi:hypothetical protein
MKIGNLKAHTGANEIQWANVTTLENDYMSFFPKKTFSYKWILEQVFSQFVSIHPYSCPNTWHVFLFIIFEWIWIFESVLIPCKFSVLFIKMITISNHNNKSIFYIFVFSFIICYNFS